jgi:hypothetical protein
MMKNIIYFRQINAFIIWFFHRIWKICSIIAMLIISPNVMAQDIVTDIIHNGNISYLDNIIETETISNLKKHELRILRNTIFAKYGYIFTSDDLATHFSRFIWYNGVTKNVKKKLTRIDWINIALIQSLERSIEMEVRDNVVETGSQDIAIIARNITNTDDFEKVVDEDILEINFVETSNYIEEIFDYQTETEEDRSLTISILDKNELYKDYEIYRIRHTTETTLWIIYAMNHPALRYYRAIKIVRKYKMPVTN